MHSDTICSGLCTSDCSERVSNRNYGLIGDNYHSRRIMFVLHHSDMRAVRTESMPAQLTLFEPVKDLDTAYWDALRKSDTGRMIGWLIGKDNKIGWEDLYITNLVKCITPGDNGPRKNEYIACRSVLERQVMMLQPKKMIAFGKKTYEHMFDGDYSKALWDVMEYNGIRCMISDHPQTIHDAKDLEAKKHIRLLRDFLMYDFW